MQGCSLLACLEDIVQVDDDEEEVTKDIITDFLKSSYVVKILKNHFHSEVTRDHCSVTEGMKNQLPTTCHLLGISWYLEQAVNAALICKDAVATSSLQLCVRASILEGNIIGISLTDSLFLFSSAVPKPVEFFKRSHIVHLSDESFQAMLTLGSIIFPKLQSVTFGGTNIRYDFLQACLNRNGLIKMKKQVLYQQIVDTHKFPEMFCQVSYM